MGNNTGSNDSDEIIPLAAPLPPKQNSTLPVLVAAFIGGLAGAVVGTLIG